MLQKPGAFTKLTFFTVPSNSPYAPAFPAATMVKFPQQAEQRAQRERGGGGGGGGGDGGDGGGGAAVRTEPELQRLDLRFVVCGSQRSSLSSFGCRFPPRSVLIYVRPIPTEKRVQQQSSNARLQQLRKSAGPKPCRRARRGRCGLRRASRLVGFSLSVRLAATEQT